MATEVLLPPVVRALERNWLGRASLRRYRRWANPRHPDLPRVLCVGFLKTGTSSFGRAMRQLGFSHFGYDRDLAGRAARGDLEPCLDFAANFDSLEDRPWSKPEFVAAYRIRFPGSHYVLLERDETQWLRSYFGFCGPICSPDEACRRYREHVDEVLDILADETHVLRMSICAGEGFEKLCPFLGLPIPDAPFPWANRGSEASRPGRGD